MKRNYPYHLPKSGLSLEAPVLGCCYYPEHRNSMEEIASDIGRIAKSGLKMIRLGEGAWWYWEPKEGKFQFDIFDYTLELCETHRIQVFMSTPTYACPAWIATDYPEILRWDYNRTPMKHGSRRNMNYTSPKYYELSDRICTALAQHYQGHKQIIGWQLDNEFNCHMSVSYAPSDTLAFQNWLQEKYRTIDQLNEAWGTKFWSQIYDKWEQIDLPHPTATYLNPSQLLDESKFISDCVVKFAGRQADILKSHNPNWKITHNALFDNIDAPELLSTLDFFSHDHYPSLFAEKWSRGSIFHLIRSRSLSLPFGIMEHQSGTGGQMHYFKRMPRPGEIRLWTWESLAHGANFINYFLWRTCPFGSEQHWHGLIDQDNRDTRRLSEISCLTQEIQIPEKNFFESKFKKTFAVLENFENEVNDCRINTYTEKGGLEARRWLSNLAERHHSVDIVWEESDWNEYPVIIVAHLRILTPALESKIHQYVEQGGIVILGARTGVYDSNVHVVEIPLPGLAQKLVGAEVGEWTSLPGEETQNVLLDNGAEMSFSIFADCLKPSTAKVAGTWKTSDLLLGSLPAVTRNKCGKGEVWYLGGYCMDGAIQKFITYLENIYALAPLVTATDDVESIARTSPDREWLVLLNHSDQKQTVGGIRGGYEILHHIAILEGAIELPPYGVAIIENKK